MIARAPYLFLLLILLPDLYLDLHYWHHRFPTWKRWLYWMPGLAMVAYTLKLTYEPNFIPDNPTLLYIYLFLLGLLVVPKVVYVLFSLCGLACCKLLRSRRNFGNLIGLFCVPVIWFVLFYGSFVGFQKLEVNRQTFTSRDVPTAFDGYRIVLFSDAHVGTYGGSRQWMLKRAVDSINAQRPDMIVFTGDLQNAHPQELYPQMDILSSLKAKDGVYSVLGNHDYDKYVNCDEAQKVANCRETISRERQMGWTVLLNEHRIIERGKDRLVIAGMENDGEGRYPQLGDINATLRGVSRKEFVIMLEHDPTSWRRKILPHCHAQLTLSGHTHGGQFSLFGWSPTSFKYKEISGMYRAGDRALYVSKGVGGVIPFRFGATGEIVVITLKKK
mgnify:CR=1 FL=1